MSIRRFLTIAACVVALSAAATGKPRSLQYYPEGRDIVCVNGDNRYTRALYGGYTDFRVETSDRPLFATFSGKNHRNVRFRLKVKGKTIALEQTARCEARYHAGKRSYRLTDPAFGRGTVDVTVLAAPDDEAAVWQFQTHGLPADAVLQCVVCRVKAKSFSRWGDLNADPRDGFDPDAEETDKMTAEWKVGDGISYAVVAVGADGNYTLSTPVGAAAQALFDKAMDHHRWLASQIVFDTPDPYINTLGAALMAAADGAWDGEVWLHGAIAWRMPLNGWRAGYLADVLGLRQRAHSHFSAYAQSQVANVPPVLPHPAQDPEKGLASAAKTWGSQMYSNGYICRRPHRDDIMHHYDMNLNFIDELLWHFQYEADTTYMRKMWPVLVSHLQWEKRNFDPDDDGLYDGYCCIWASDALYYSSGAVTHASAYNYRAHALAARIAEFIGENPEYFKREAQKTLEAMNRRLWISQRGHWAEYQDFMGLKRLHTHAALWSIYTPIDCGAASAEMAFRATQYVDSCIPHIPVVIDKAAPAERHLQTISTSDWLPYEWSINNVAAEEVMHMALAYFLAGRQEEGFNLLKANIMDQAYLGDSPGNFGQVSYYDKARGELYRDFSDNTGISARTFLQGLFGIVPDALNGRCILRPGFPEHWKRASVSTPYFKYSFRRVGNKEIYEIEQNFAQPLQIVLRQNTGYGYVETVGSSEKKQTIIVKRPKRVGAPKPLVTAERVDGTAWGNNFDDVQTERLAPVDISRCFNSQVSVDIAGGIPFRFPQQGRNIVYTSLWDNYPDAVEIPLSGSASHAYLLMAGSTNHMQSRIDNGVVTVRYTDGSADTLRLCNPHNWCPIEQDYYEDGLAFHAAQPRPYRLDFASLRVSRQLMPMGDRYGYEQRYFEKGAGIVLDMPLNRSKQLQSLTLRTLSNDIVVGLMAVTLQH